MPKDNSLKKIFCFSNAQSKKEIESFLNLVYKITGNSYSNIIETTLRDSIFTSSQVRNQFISRILVSDDPVAWILSDLWLYASTLQRNKNYPAIRDLCFVVRRVYLETKKEIPDILDEFIHLRKEDPVSHEMFLKIAEMIRHDTDLVFSDIVRFDMIRIIKDMSEE